MPNAVMIGSLFMFGAVAMTGMPPLSGFLGKVLILSAALDQAWFFAILSVVLIASLLTIIAMARSGSLLFYRTQPCHTLPGESLNKSALIAVVGLFAASPLLVIFANPVTGFTELVAQQQFDTASYIEAVLTTPAIERVK
jgi:multicomponent K+:H+ antiporter subunit D